MISDKEKDQLLGPVHTIRTESKEVSTHQTSYSPEPQDSHPVIYDTEGRKTTEEWRRRDGSLSLKYVFFYNGFGNLIEESSYKVDGSMTRKIEYAYDAYDRRTREHRFTGDGALVREMNYAYKTDGRMIEETLLNDQAREFDSEPSYKVEGIR